MAAAKTRKKPEMSDAHLQALAKGRSESAVVRRYLVALENHKPRRGRKRTPDSMRKRLDTVEKQLNNADPLTKVQLIQERIDLLHQIESNSDTVDMKSLEDGFIKSAKTYGKRKGITYAAWREFGVDAAVLKKAGISRAS